MQDHLIKNTFFSFGVTGKEILLRYLICWSSLYLPDIQCNTVEREHVLEFNIVF